MPFKYDATNNAIRMACGDTAEFTVRVKKDDLTEGDVLVFAFFDETGNDLLRKPFEIENGAVKIRICNHDTRDIEAGNYKWNLRLVTNPDIDENGNVIVDDCSSDVITLFDNPPKFTLTIGGARV